MDQQQLDDLQRTVFVIREPPEWRAAVWSGIACALWLRSQYFSQPIDLSLTGKRPDVAAVRCEEIDQCAMIVMACEAKRRRVVLRFPDVGVGAPFEEQACHAERITSGRRVQSRSLARVLQVHGNTQVEQQRDDINPVALRSGEKRFRRLQITPDAASRAAPPLPGRDAWRPP